MPDAVWTFLVQPPDGGVEGSGEGDPGEVGAPEEGGGAVLAEESELDDDQKRPQGADFHKREVGAALAKEEDRPEGVGAELHGVQPESGDGPGWTRRSQTRQAAMLMRV